jgi:hypothetical protein
VTVITFGAGCSITSAATTSTTGVTGCFTFRAAFFTGVGLDFALATVRFAALATLRALPRLAVFPFGSFPRFCTFARFLPLAMTRPVLVGGPQRIDAGSPTPSNLSNELSTDHLRLGPNAVALGVNDAHLTTNSLTSLHTPIPK